MVMTRLVLGTIAVSGGLALLLFSVMLAGLGMFCFDGVLWGEFRNLTTTAPDCFVVSVNAWVNPKIWLLGNLLFAIALSLWAHATAYGLLKARAWVRMFSLVGTFFGILYFVELAAALPEFRTISIVSITAMACFSSGCLVLQKLQTLPRPQN
jgi:hypothetical protein